MTVDAKQIAESALAMMQASGFDDSHVSVSISEQDELNMNHNAPSLLRSTENYNIGLIGIVDGRKAATTLTDVDPEAMKKTVQSLFEDAQSAPQDDANAVSENQVAHFEQGPLASNRDLLAEKAEELLNFRAAQTPNVIIEEATVSHRIARSYDVTSRGTALSCVIGCYEMGAAATGTEGEKSSSLNYTGGRCNDLHGTPGQDWFALGDMLLDTQRQIHTRPLGERFTGEVILAPTAVSDLVSWFLSQLGSTALISGSSVYRDRVGDSVAAATLSLHSHFDAPGHAPFTSDGFKAEPLELIQGGKLTSLLVDHYGSHKTGIAHTPSSSGWRILPGTDSTADLIASVKQGALVTRFSMGSPGANGDFSGIIKNSFIIENGEVGGALAETMVAGNMAAMLENVSGISQEHIDFGGEDFPWLRIPGLHFS